ncbi:MAG: zf-HC2 domain-containing protein [Armatimonadota bacterium]|nr:zf-HC2 domain-containing protein [bacterium]
MNCAKAQDMFSAYLENVMEPSQRVAFEQHLATCPSCKASYEKFNAALMMLEEMPQVEPPADFHASVMARVERERRVEPSKVRWWNLDWQHVFTIRVPARAVAMGFAVLLLMVMAVQFTPIGHSINAVVFPGRTVGNPVGDDDSSDAPKAGVLNSGCDLAKSGLCINVSNDSSGKAYTLRLSSKDGNPVDYSVYTRTGTSAKNGVANGFVSRGQQASVTIDVAHDRQTVVTELKWHYRGRSYDRLAFLPPTFDADASAKKIDMSFNKTTVYQALDQVSRSYGIVILASGNLNRTIKFGGVDDGNATDAIYAVADKANMTWQALAASVYEMEPTD